MFSVSQYEGKRGMEVELLAVILIVTVKELPIQFYIFAMYWLQI
jgi:hypothetical protein